MTSSRLDSLCSRSLTSRSLFARALWAPTALALALTTALSPLAAADRVDPSAQRPFAPRPVPELPPRTNHHVTRFPPNTPVANTPPPTGFAQPPTGWSSTRSSDPLPEVPAADPVVRMIPEHGDQLPPIIMTKAAVRAALAEARATSIAAFKSYLDSQVYPSNTFTKGTLNVWRDAEGHFCAAATIVRLSGRLAIADDVASTNNNLRLIHVKDGVLMDWILTSGLTQQEIDRIQMPFIGVGQGGMPRPMAVDETKKVAETGRLLKAYRATYAVLLKSNKASLEIAVNRLMAHPELARDFLDGSLAIRDQR